MTTNTTKLAEAIGLLSTVLSSEIAQTNNPFEVEDDDETVALETYDELKDTTENFNEEVSNDLEVIRGEISDCLEWENDDALANDWSEKMWDDDDDDVDTETEGEEEATSEESTGEENTTDESSSDDEAKIIEQAMEEAQTRIAELESSNEKIKAVLESVGESVNDLIELSSNFADEVEAY